MDMKQHYNMNSKFHIVHGGVEYYIVDQAYEHEVHDKVDTMALPNCYRIMLAGGMYFLLGIDKTDDILFEDFEDTRDEGTNHILEPKHVRFAFDNDKEHYYITRSYLRIDAFSNKVLRDTNKCTISLGGNMYVLEQMDRKDMHEPRFSVSFTNELSSQRKQTDWTPALEDIHDINSAFHSVPIENLPHITGRIKQTDWTPAPEDIHDIMQMLNMFADDVFATAENSGKYKDKPELPPLMMHVISELTEAVQSYLYDNSSNTEHVQFALDNLDNAMYRDFFKNNLKSKFEDEIADAILILFSIARYLDIDIVTHLILKNNYNKVREEHSVFNKYEQTKYEQTK